MKSAFLVALILQATAMPTQPKAKPGLLKKLLSNVAALTVGTGLGVGFTHLLGPDFQELNRSIPHGAIWNKDISALHKAMYPNDVDSPDADFLSRLSKDILAQGQLRKFWEIKSMNVFYKYFPDDNKKELEVLGINGDEAIYDVLAKLPAVMAANDQEKAIAATKVFIDLFKIFPAKRQEMIERLLKADSIDSSERGLDRLIGKLDGVGRAEVMFIVLPSSHAKRFYISGYFNVKQENIQQLFDDTLSMQPNMWLNVFKSIDLPDETALKNQVEDIFEKDQTKLNPLFKALIGNEFETSKDNIALLKKWAIKFDVKRKNAKEFFDFSKIDKDDDVNLTELWISNKLP